MGQILMNPIIIIKTKTDYRHEMIRRRHNTIYKGDGVYYWVFESLNDVVASHWISYQSNLC